MDEQIGFYIESSEVTEWEASLSTYQIGIIIRLFANLSGKKKRRGFLADTDGTALSERRLRQICGGSGNPVSHTTWIKTRDALVACGILMPMKVRDNELLFCPAYMKRVKKVERPRKAKQSYGIAFYLGYDPTASPTDTWGHLCRKWIDCTAGENSTPRPLFPLDWDDGAKKSARCRLIKLADEIGLDEALHDIGIVFGYKTGRMERVSSLSYFIARWMAQDFRKAQAAQTGGEKLEGRAAVRARLQEEINILIRDKIVDSRRSLLAYFPRANVEILKNIALELGLG